MAHKTTLMVLTYTIVLSACGGGGNANTIPQMTATPTTSQADLNEAYTDELDLIDEVLRNNHPDLFFNINESTYVTELEALKSTVVGESEINFRLASAKFVAQIGDQHTYLIIPEPFLKRFPFEIWWDNDKAVITRAGRGYSEYLGFSIETVDGTDFSSLKDIGMQYLAYQNSHWKDALSPRYIKYADMLVYEGITASNDSATYTLTSQDGVTISLDIPSFDTIEWVDIASTHQRPPLYSRSDDNFHLIVEEDLAFVQYNSAFNSNTYNVDTLISDLDLALSEQDIEKVVFDLRFNHGGVIDHFVPVVEFIAETEYNNPGQLFVLTGRNSFSSAVGAIYSFKNLSNATFVGMPTGGKPNGYSRVAGLQLVSANALYVATDYLEVTSEEVDTFTPDYLTPFTQADFLQGNDPALSFIRNNF